MQSYDICVGEGADADGWEAHDQGQPYNIVFRYPMQCLSHNAAAGSTEPWQQSIAQLQVPAPLLESIDIDWPDILGD
jgi:hypothetical protein